MTILITASIMYAANVYYDLDTQTIMVNDAQQMSKGLVVSGAATSALSGHVDIDGTTAVTGNNGTLFTKELVKGDRITIGTETRTVTAIGGDAALTVDTAFANTLEDTTPQRQAAQFITNDSSGDVNFIVQDNGNVGVGITAPTAFLQLKAGVDAAGSAPLKFTAGPLMTAEEVGAMEFDGDHIYITDDLGARHQLDQQSGTTYGATGTLLQLSGNDFSVKEGTLTNGYLCTYVAGTGIVCNTSGSSVGHVGVTGASIGSTPNAVGMSFSGTDNQTLTLQPANETYGGVVSDTTQRFVGAKTFDTSLTSTGTLTANGTLDANGIVTLGDNGENVTIDSNVWDITGAGAASGLTGLASTGTIAFSGGGTFSIDSSAFDVTTAGAVSGVTTLTTAGTASINVTGTAATSIGNTTGVLAMLSGGASSWENSAGELTIKTTTSGDLTFSTARLQDEINLDPNTGGAGVIRLGAGDQILTSGGGAATRLSGEEVLVGIVPIFGYDYPAQTKSGSFKDVSRIIEANPFPAEATGTTRAYKFIIRYADDYASGNTTSWNLYDVTTPASSVAFSINSSPTTDLEKGVVEIKDADTNMAALIDGSDDWNLQVHTDGTKSIRIYSIDLAAYDVVD